MFIFYSENSEKLSDNFHDNLINKSMDANVYPGDSIQNAINNVSSGGTVIVYPGLYKENLFVDKPLVIMSKEGTPANTVVQAADPEKDVFNVTADKVTISGFNITGAQSNAGIYYSGSDGNISGNKLDYNKYGILLKNSKNITIRNNTAFYNVFGIYLSYSGENVLENNKANNCSHCGIYVENSTENELIFNVANSNYKYAMYLKSSNNNWLKNNNISNLDVVVDKDGIKLEDSDNNRLINNDISNNWKGVNLSNSSDNELNKNRVSANYFSVLLLNSNNNKLLDNVIELNKYDFSISLGSSQNNILNGNTVGLNKETAGFNKEIKIFYSHDSTNNTLEGVLYTDNGKGTGGIFRVK
ncbi:hypothetical protein SDC9_138086 [bioreactor metagenome]|uniref:Carbohydrate-binding/sugar hydrolysis domain-containing protein n=1 Tax=bioreactor metagenome TaxID=1076179 RepID=A0A645DQH2_9ZZZZ